MNGIDRRMKSWIYGDTSVCVVCNKDFKYCPHSHLDADQKIKEWEIMKIIKKMK